MTDRLPKPEYDGVFCDINRPLDAVQAKIESSRCYYCYDAPCIQACPTSIDIPSFIRKISNGNTRGAALDILDANIMGGTCARVCPVETLCQSACVRNHSESKPVVIGQLQRFATDAFFKTGEQPFKRAKATGHKIAVVGAGPAGLSCAHKLATLGYEVTVYEKNPKAGGLNEYGLAPYKVTEGFVGREVDFILGVGGIDIQYGQALGRDFELSGLTAKYAAVFLGIGLGAVNALKIPGEELPGVIDAVKHIAQIRQATDLSKIPVGRHVVVIGGGNTAIDIAIQIKRLGAEFVTLAYRRGEEQMGATDHEQALAKENGVLIKTFVQPIEIIGDSRGVQGVKFEYTRLDPSGKLQGTGDHWLAKADQVFKAIGQALAPTGLGASAAPELAGGKILARESSFATTQPKVYAGGDCVKAGEDLTVTAVEQGKQAALAIHRDLSAHEVPRG